MQNDTIVKKRQRGQQRRHKWPLNLEEVRALLNYDAATGRLTWRMRRGKAVRGAIAGTPTRDGYVLVRIRGNAVSAHRLVWFMVNGQWPPAEIDHINGCPSDNRICNLRLATRSQNNRNRRASSTSSSGRVGVAFHRGVGSWVAYIGAEGKRLHLGVFTSKEAATEARAAAEKKFYGEFVRLGDLRK